MANNYTTTDSLMEIYLALTRLESKFEEHDKRGTAYQADHELRIRSVERWQYAIPPAVVLSIGGIIAALFG